MNLRLYVKAGEILSVLHFHKIGTVQAEILFNLLWRSPEYKSFHIL